MSSSVCLSAKSPGDFFYHFSDPFATQCSVVDPAFVPINDTIDLIERDFSSCAIFQRRNIICMHGDGLSTGEAVCPRLVDQVDPHALPNTRWIEHFTVLVPSYPYPRNIFHFANVASSIPYFVDHLPQMVNLWGASQVRSAENGMYFGYMPVSVKQVTIFMQIPEAPIQYGTWQRDLLEAMVKYRLRARGINVTLEFLSSNPNTRHEHLCLRNALVLGKGGHVNFWPFPNTTELNMDGHSIPADAVKFKRAVYEAMDVPARLPMGNRGISELPPLVVGYAKRVTQEANLTNNALGPGAVRRFNADDEEWFGDMLRNETGRVGVKLSVFTPSGKETLKEQVTNIVKIGFIVGIHGANLVNSIFIHPFGALLEILPAQAQSKCYLGGMNTGMAYYRHESTEYATAEESGCPLDATACFSQRRYRMVKLGSKVDRDAVRRYVQDGLRHLIELHKRYPYGIPVKYNAQTISYDIDSS